MMNPFHRHWMQARNRRRIPPIADKYNAEEPPKYSPTIMLQRTKVFGRVHQDTKSFDDSQVFGENAKETSIVPYSSLTSTKIVRMKIWSGNNVNGIQVFFFVKFPH